MDSYIIFPFWSQDVAELEGSELGNHSEFGETTVVEMASWRRRGYAAPCGDWSEPERKPTSHEVIERNHFVNTLQPPLPQSFAKSPSFCSQIVFFQLIFPTDFIFQTNMTRFSKALLRIRKVSEQSLRDFSIPSLGVLTFVTPSTGLSPVSFEQERVKLRKDTYSHAAPGVASKSGTEFGTR